MMLLIIPFLHHLCQFNLFMIQQACLGYLPFSRNWGGKSENVPPNNKQKHPLLSEPGTARPQRLSECYPAQSSIESSHHPAIADQDGEHKAPLTETKISWIWSDDIFLLIAGVSRQTPGSGRGIDRDHPCLCELSDHWRRLQSRGCLWMNKYGTDNLVSIHCPDLFLLEMA